MVVIDSPPMALLASARSLAARSDGVVLVVRAGQSKQQRHREEPSRRWGRRSSSARCSTARASRRAATVTTTSARIDQQKRNRLTMIRLFSRYWCCAGGGLAGRRGPALIVAVRLAMPAAPRARAGDAAARSASCSSTAWSSRSSACSPSTSTASTTSASGCRRQDLVIRLLRAFTPGGGRLLGALLPGADLRDRARRLRPVAHLRLLAGVLAWRVAAAHGAARRRASPSGC